jgi:hypothetical protein
MKTKYIVKAIPSQATRPVGKPGLQLLPSKTNPQVKRWEQTQKRPPIGKPGQPIQSASGAEVGHRINYHGNHITITGVGEHGVTARDEHGRKYQIFHHELRRRGKQ